MATILNGIHVEMPDRPRLILRNSKHRITFEVRNVSLSLPSSMREQPRARYAEELLEMLNPAPSEVGSEHV